MTDFVTQYFFFRLFLLKYEALWMSFYILFLISQKFGAKNGAIEVFPEATMIFFFVTGYEMR